jgi:hypothetical protein
MFGGGVCRKGKFLLIRLRLRASEVRLGDRLCGVEGQPNRLVVQVRRLSQEVRLLHGGADETRLTGDPFVWIMRNEPRVIEEELPHTIWGSRAPRRIQPWEGDR